MIKNIYYKYISRLRNTIYHFKVADYKLIKEYSRNLGLAYIPWYKILQASWLNGASFHDYFELKFFEKSFSQRKEWITTSLRHELTRQVNNLNKTILLKDKLLFAENFKPFLGRNVYSWSEIEQIDRSAKITPIVLKPRFGQAGKGIFFVENIKTFSDLIEYILQKNIDAENYIYESYISNQHLVLKNISPESLNTLRIVTFNNNGIIQFWGCYLRMGINSKLDSVTKGGIAACVQLDGIIRTPAVSKNPFEQSYPKHPISNVLIIGTQIPYWDKVITLVTEAARLIPEIRSIGWDVAITDDGPCLIEGNDNWSNFLQIAIGKGLRITAGEVADMSILYS